MEGREAWKEKAHRIFLEKTREGHRQSDEHWNRFKGDIKGNFWETEWSAYGLLRAHRLHLELNLSVEHCFLLSANANESSSVIPVSQWQVRQAVCLCHVRLAREKEWQERATGRVGKCAICILLCWQTVPFRKQRLSQPLRNTSLSYADEEWSIALSCFCLVLSRLEQHSGSSKLYCSPRRQRILVYCLIRVKRKHLTP